MSLQQNISISPFKILKEKKLKYYVRRLCEIPIEFLFKFRNDLLLIRLIEQKYCKLILIVVLRVWNHERSDLRTRHVIDQPNLNFGLRLDHQLSAKEAWEVVLIKLVLILMVF
jgi:hypothetical protein